MRYNNLDLYGNNPFHAHGLWVSLYYYLYYINWDGQPRISHIVPSDWIFRSVVNWWLFSNANGNQLARPVKGLAWNAIKKYIPWPSLCDCKPFSFLVNYLRISAAAGVSFHNYQSPVDYSENYQPLPAFYQPIPFITNLSKHWPCTVIFPRTF